MRNHFKQAAVQSTKSKSSTGINVDVRSVQQSTTTEPDFWVPFYLRRWTLLAFAVTYSVLAVVLGILADYSAKHDGISSANSRQHYLWTYGPTAVFTLVTFFWSRTEYHAKQLQPWVQMRKGYQPASQSVLLDYISPLRALALLRSVRNRHLLPALAIAGTFLISFVTVISTGLFTLQNVYVDNHNAALTVTERFALADPNFWDQQTTYKMSYGDFRPTTVVLALAKGKSSFPNGTTDQQAFPQFKPRGHLSSLEPSSTQANVDVFQSTLDCEPATFSGYWEYSNILNKPFYTWWGVSVSSESCSQADYLGAPKEKFQNQLTSAYGIDKGQQGSGFEIVKCATHAADDHTNGMRMLFYTGNVYKTAYHPEKVTIEHANSNKVTSKNIDVALNMSALLCAPKYQVYKAPVTIDESGNATVTPSPANQRDSKTIKGFHAWNLAASFYNSVTASEYFIRAENTHIQGGSAWSSNEINFAGEQVGIWQLLNIVNPQKSTLDWIDDELVNVTLRNIWTMWTAQMAAFRLKEPADENTTGSTTRLEPRLVLHLTPFALIEAGLALLVLVSVVLAFTMPRDIIPRNPSSLGGLATILSQSKDLRDRLEGSWPHSEKGFRAALEGDMFSADVQPNEAAGEQPRFCVDIQLSSLQKEELPTASNDAWWHPTAASKWYMIGIPIFTICLIGLLEGLYQLSESQNGLTGITSPDSYIHFTWTTIPATILFFAAAAFGTLNFAVQALQPFQQLKKGSAPASTGLFKYPFNGARPSSIKQAFRDRELATILAMIMVFLASFLTIVVSGLFTAHRVPTTKPISVQQKDWFASNTTVHNHSPVQIEAVTVGNLSYPKFTYETLAFPRLEAQDASVVGTIKLKVPAVHSVMNCSVFNSNDIVSINSSRDISLNDYKYRAEILVKDDSQCLEIFNYAGVSGYDPPKGEVMLDRILPFASGTRYSEYWLTLPETGYFGYLTGAKTQNRPGCPHAWGIVGRTSEHKIKDPTFFTCTPYTHKVQVDATFHTPSMEIDKTNPPVITNEPSQLFPIHFTYQPHGNAVSGYQYFVGNPWDTFRLMQLPKTAVNADFGPFMNILVSGTGGVPAQELVDPANTDLLFSKINRLWGISVAQLVANYRIPKANPNPMPATLETKVSYRLFQSGLDTRILEGLLGGILICVIATFCTMETRKVLKQNPCTIAGLGSLLAGSELLANNAIPEGAEWQSDEELLANSALGGWVFSLGWWRVPGHVDEKRFGVDIGRADEAP